MLVLSTPGTKALTFLSSSSIHSRLELRTYCTQASSPQQEPLTRGGNSTKNNEVDRNIVTPSCAGSPTSRTNPPPRLQTLPANPIILPRWPRALCRLSRIRIRRERGHEPILPPRGRWVARRFVGGGSPNLRLQHKRKGKLHHVPSLSFSDRQKY
jgi:hypothetical protein